MKFIKSLFFIFLFLLLGEFVVLITPIPIPGNLIGMLLLFFSLVFEIVKLEDIAIAGDLLIEHLVLYFVPVSIGIVAYKQLLLDEFISVFIVVIFGFFVLYFIISKLIDILVSVFGKKGF